MTRHKDVDWTMPAPIGCTEHAMLAVLMDLRDELKKLNAVFACPNFVEVPRILRRIARNTAKPRKTAKKRRSGGTK